MPHTRDVQVTLAVHMGTATLRVYASLTETPSLLQNSKTTIGHLHEATLMEFAVGLRKSSAYSLMASLTQNFTVASGGIEFTSRTDKLG
jgi:hypothetical protein